MHEHDEDFEECYELYKQIPKGAYLFQNGYLFKRTRLCVPKCGTRKLLIREVHREAPAGHYRENKTTLMLKEHYY